MANYGNLKRNLAQGTGTPPLMDFNGKLITIKYEDIYSEHKKQKVVTSIIAKLLNIRKQILENRENTTNPSNLNGLLRSSYNVLLTILLGSK